MIVQNKIPATIAELEAFRQESLRSAAIFLKDKMQDTIIKQTERWVPLSIATLRKKFPEIRKLIEKGDLVKAIKAKIYSTEATIGVHKEESRWEVGIYNEYGAPDAGIPSRPFVRSTWAKHQKTVISMIQGIFIRRMKVGK